MTFWAKNGSNGKIKLSEHTENVIEAAIKIYLAQHGNVMSEEQKRMLILSAFLHDLGKAIPEFQKRILQDILSFNENEIKIAGLHHLISPLLMNINSAVKYIVNGSCSIIDENDIVKAIITAVIYHHLKDREKTRHSSEFINYVKKLSSNKQLIKDLREHMSSLIEKYQFPANIIDFNEELIDDIVYSNSNLHVDWAFELYSHSVISSKVSRIEDKEVIIISGALKIADHTASFCEKESIKISDLAQKLALVDKETARKKVLDYLRSKGATNPWQDKYVVNSKKKHTILIAPPGQGKTEAAFIAAAGKKTVFALPLRAATEQIYHRASHIFGKDKVGILHSDTLSFLYKIHENNGQNINNNDEALEDIDVQMHLSKNIISPIVILTGDQIVPAVFKHHGYDKIYSILPGSCTVIDEVQFYDIRSIAVIERFIEDVMTLNGSLLIMTATMPEYFKQRILAKRDKENDFDIIDLYEIYKDKFQNLIKHYVSIIYDNERNYIDKAIQLAKENKRILILVNTVKEAQYVYQTIMNKVDEYMKDDVYLLHSRFTMNDRQRIEQKVMSEFANTPRNATKGKILVATQVAEVSLDIDADYMFTEVAPADSLVQRMGRVMRRYKDTSPTLTEPNVYIVINDKIHSGNNAQHPVYEKDIIFRTLEILLKRSSVNTNITLSEDAILEIIKENSGNIVMSLSEYDKYEINKELYNYKAYFDRYIEQYETIEYYKTDDKRKAHEVFRDIDNETVLPDNRKDQFLEKVMELIEKNQLDYVHFKIHVIDEFFVSIPPVKKDKSQKSDCTIKDIITNNEAMTKTDKKIVNKITSWTRGVKVFGQYDNKIGFIK